MQPGAAILIAKSGISNHAASNILDDLCFSKFGTFHVACPQTADNLRTFVCAPCWHHWTQHNRAKPMSELSSALFSIADDNEFRFARFYIVCEAVPLGAPESPLIVCGFAGHTTGTVQTWKDTEPDARRSTEEILGFCFKELPPWLHSGTSYFLIFS